MSKENNSKDNKMIDSLNTISKDLLEYNNREISYKEMQLKEDIKRLKFDKLQLFLYITAIIVSIFIVVILSFALTRVKSDLSCTINGVSYDSQETNNYYHTPNTKLENSTISCNGSIDVPMFIITALR